MDSSSQPMNPAKVWVQLVVRMAFFAVALMWPAGTWRWLDAWIVFGIWVVFAVAIVRYLIRHDPALLAERMNMSTAQKDQKRWDKVLMLVFMVPAIGLYVIPGFDVVRFGWSDPFPAWVRIVAMLIHIPCFLMLAWVMRENSYLARVVKIDKARHHQVVTTGPYVIVRHPMYTAVIVMLFAMPTALGSRYALIISLLVTVLLIVRTYLEDRTLYRELDGYPEFTRKTPYRLFPGIW